MMLQRLEEGRKRKELLRAYVLKLNKDFHQKLKSSSSSLSSLRRGFKEKVSLFISEILPSRVRLCGAYMSLNDEFPLEQIVNDFPRIKWAYPKVAGKKLAFYIPFNLSKKSFIQGSWGLREPNVESSKKISISKLEAVFIPAVAYDRKLRRLGRGGGYYDRALTNFRGLKIGVCYSVQVLNEDLPFEKKQDGSEDIEVDFVVTEKFFFHRYNKVLIGKLRS